MVKGIVKKTMYTALNRFAEIEQETAQNIQLFIHTKNEQLLPEYFYAIKGVVKQQDGKTLQLSFVKDILGKKMDLTGKEAMSNQFLMTYFKTVAQEEKESPNKLYIMVLLLILSMGYTLSEHRHSLSCWLKLRVIFPLQPFSRPLS